MKSCLSHLLSMKEALRIDQNNIFISGTREIRERSETIEVRRRQNKTDCLSLLRTFVWRRNIGRCANGSSHLQSRHLLRQYTKKRKTKTTEDVTVSLLAWVMPIPHYSLERVKALAKPLIFIISENWHKYAEREERDKWRVRKKGEEKGGRRETSFPYSLKQA